MKETKKHLSGGKTIVLEKGFYLLCNDKEEYEFLEKNINNISIEERTHEENLLYIKKELKKTKIIK
ncbi:MAG: hypothetical protein GY849_02255 [Deltaproteobacteria bacterium]|nr:hypothetical protein [Deltaproteobacteria bacterium]